MKINSIKYEMQTNGKRPCPVRDKMLVENGIRTNPTRPVRDGMWV
jgi:hypothetical protein